MKAVVEFVAAHPYAFGAVGFYAAFFVLWWAFRTGGDPIVDEEDLDQ